MNHDTFKQAARAGETLVTPVIHVIDANQALRNLDVIDAAGCPGAFLINHDFPVDPFLPILKEVRAARPDLWLGVNFLDQPGNIAFPILGQLAREGCRIDAYWADDARIDERKDRQATADEIEQIRKDSGWTGVYLGGVAFKKQRPVAEDQYARSARLSVPYLDVVCTSGIATGHEADLSKIETFREAIGDAPLALASGITPENAASYRGLVNCFLVATGINYPGDFYNIDRDRLDALLAVTRKQGEPV
ncbi:BtpA/SgcQ family protein [Gymnodinialimonas ulvae]|uniref:BtpA/SgcQ family protein n=1 Tax=Gymnodinialimonas ulvae TaxID=3126504 RepID=UPI0030A79D8D